MISGIWAAIFALFALMVTYLSLNFYVDRRWFPGGVLSILGLLMMFSSGIMASDITRGEPKSELATGRYHVYACARHGNIQHCLLDKLGDDENTVRYYTFPAAIEEDPDIRVHGTYPPRRIISVWEQNGKKIVFMPTHLIYDWPGDHS